VADFGIGRALGLQQPTDRLTDVGMVVGTPAYMAPEQAMGESTVDGRSDVYALGTVVFEMLAGEPPFTGSTAQVVLAKRFSGEVPRLRQFRPAVPEPVEQAVTRALAMTPADRFQTGSEFGRALAASSATPSGVPTVLSGEIGRTAGSPKRVRAPLLAVLGLGFLLGVGVLFAWRRSHSAAGDAGPKRIAVLPFVNLNRAEDEYFAEGITDDVRGKLAALSGMQVTARSSSGRYSQTAKSPQEIGRELGVDYLLTGTVRWDKGQGGKSRVRVSPELVQTATGSTSWQEAFEAPITDIFQVQADIAGRVAGALDVALRAGQREQLAERPTRNLAAYDLYLRGRHAWHRRTAKGLDLARELFEQAIKLDPDFARAHAGLADVYVVMPLWSDVAPSQTYPRAKAAALQALRLDSTLAEPEAALADVHAMYEWNWPAAERRFRRALALDPANANTHHWYSGDYLTAMGRLADAIREERRARELDPLSPTINASVGISLYRAKRYDEALADLEAARSLDPDFGLASYGVGSVYLMQGRYDDAVEAFERAIDPKVRHSADVAFLGYAYAKAGRRPEALRLLRELKDRGTQAYVSPTNIGVLLTGLGDTLGALQWLERAVQQHDPQLLYNFIPEPLLEGVRSRPEGAALVKRMGLPLQ
jgi:serine/threonine-protein kinase